MSNETVYFEKAKESLASAEADFTDKRYNSCTRGAYYACFQTAISALVKAGIPKPDNGKWRHEFVKGQFVLQFINRRKKYSEQFRDTLERLSNLGRKADYEATMITPKEASRLLSVAKAFSAHIMTGK